MSNNNIEWRDEWQEPFDKEGHLLCRKCNARMVYESRPSTRTEVAMCPNCGYEFITEYWDEDDDEDEEWTADMMERYGGNVPPPGCRACGGPYPSCMSSCKLFDD